MVNADDCSHSYDDSYIFIHGYCLPGGGETCGRVALTKPPVLRMRNTISAFVTQERAFVRRLEVLHDLKMLLEARGSISNDQIHTIFLNLNRLVDFHRRFLITIEQQTVLLSEQNWGKLFICLKDDYPPIFEIFANNQVRSLTAVLKFYERLKKAATSPELRKVASRPSYLT